MAHQASFLFSVFYFLSLAKILDIIALCIKIFRMTLKNRNSLMNSFFIFASCFLVITFFTLILVLNSKNPPKFVATEYMATVTAICTMIVFVPTTFYLMIRFFSHTQAPEIIYVWIFLFGMMCESTRIFILLFDLWQTNSLIAISRIVLFGRFLALLSFFFIAITSDLNEQKSTEQNIFITLAVSLLFSSIIPINTSKIEISGMVTPGYNTIFITVQFFFIMATFLIFLFNAINKDTSESKKNTLRMAFSYLSTILGFIHVSASTNFIAFGFGAILLTAGMFAFLFCLHKLYLWQ